MAGGCAAADSSRIRAASIEQKFPLPLDSAPGRQFERVQLKLAAGNGQQLVEGRFTSRVARLGVNNPAVFNVNPAPQLLVVDFEDGRVAAEAFHLNDIVHADPAQHALESFPGCPGDQFLQHDEDGSQPIGRARFFNEQFRALGEAGGTLFLGGVGGDHRLFQVRMAPVEDVEKLDAVQASAC